MTSTAHPRPASIRLAPVVGLTVLMAAAAGALALALSGDTLPGSAFTLGLPLMVVIAAVAELASVDRRIAGHNHTLSLSEVALVVGLAFAAPTDLMLGRIVAGLVVYGAIRRIPTPKLAYTMAVLALETAVAAAAYRALLGANLAHEPASWVVLGLAVLAATAIGLGAVRGILYLHGAPQSFDTAILSLGVTAVATLIGITAVVAISLHTPAAVLIVALSAAAFVAMRTISALIDRANATG